MKIELPLETWTEMFGFVPRSQLKKLVPHFGEKRQRDRRGRKCQQTIGDRTFVTFVQFYLHQCGEVTFGRLRIYPSKGGHEPKIRANGKEWPLADVPIPANVKNFESIIISNYGKSHIYGESVIAFLRKFEQNSLLANVNLRFDNCPTYLLQIMTKFLPLFTSINSIEITNLDVLDKLQCEYSELAIAVPMLASAQRLYTDYNCRDFWFCDWLNIPREDGKPRVLVLYGEQEDRSSSLYYFIKHIKKDFLEANQAVSFFILLEDFREEASVQSLTLENGKTQEILVINGARADSVKISRYPMGTNKNKWIKEIRKRASIHNRQILFKEI